MKGDQMKDYSKDPIGFSRDILELPETSFAATYKQLDLSKPFRVLTGHELYMLEKRRAARVCMGIAKLLGWNVVTYADLTDSERSEP